MSDRQTCWLRLLIGCHRPGWAQLRRVTCMLHCSTECSPGTGRLCQDSASRPEACQSCL